MSSSALYAGKVVHTRTRRHHRLRYSIFQLLLDLDDLDDLDTRLRLFSVRRWNLVGFDPADHLAGPAVALRDQVRALAAQSGIVLDGGPIRLLCMPRVLGHAFNPLSLFFCHRLDGALAAILYEVNNTFGERHVYVMPVEPDQAEGPWIEQSCAKSFFVSPFMPMDLNYAFRVLLPGPAAAVRLEVADAEGPLLFASFHGKGELITDGALLRAFLGAPLLSLKVLGAIHWEALWIWLKGMSLQPRTPRSGMGVTVVQAGLGRDAA